MCLFYILKSIDYVDYNLLCGITHFPIYIPRFVEIHMKRHSIPISERPTVHFISRKIVDLLEVVKLVAVDSFP